MASDQELLDAFSQMDTGGDGVLSGEEIRKYLLSKNFDESFVQSFITNFDIDSDGKVTLDEYKQQLGMIPPSEKSFSAWKSVFCSFDSDGSGYIDAAEIPKILEECNIDTSQYSKENFTNWINEHDKDKDGRVNYEEFLQFIKG